MSERDWRVKWEKEKIERKNLKKDEHWIGFFQRFLPFFIREAFSEILAELLSFCHSSLSLFSISLDRKRKWKNNKSTKDGERERKTSSFASSSQIYARHIFLFIFSSISDATSFSISLRNFFSFQTLLSFHPIHPPLFSSHSSSSFSLFQFICVHVKSFMNLWRLFQSITFVRSSTLAFFPGPFNFLPYDKYYFGWCAEWIGFHLMMIFSLWE